MQHPVQFAKTVTGIDTIGKCFSDTTIGNCLKAAAAAALDLLVITKVATGIKAAQAAETAAAAAETAASDWPEVSGVLRDAAKGKGNFGLGSATQEQAGAAGQAWVGDGATLASDGKTWVSQDGLRQFRAPSFKPNLNQWQSNFEWRVVPRGPWQGNGHLDITDPP